MIGGIVVVKTCFFDRPPWVHRNRFVWMLSRLKLVKDLVVTAMTGEI
jgi:hypothetical protein